MKKLIAILALLSLTACAGPVQLLAHMYDSADPCQNYYHKSNYKYPSYCGASSGKTYITRDYMSNKAITSTRVER